MLPPEELTQMAVILTAPQTLTIVIMRDLEQHKDHKDHKRHLTGVSESC